MKVKCIDCRNSRVFAEAKEGWVPVLKIPTTLFMSSLCLGTVLMV